MASKSYGNLSRLLHNTTIVETLKIKKPKKKLIVENDTSTVKFRGLYFSKAFFEGLIFGGAYIRREICISKSIGLAL